MQLEGPHQLTDLKPTIGSLGASRLRSLLRHEHKVWFIPDEPTARSEPGLTDDERAFALRMLASHPWTYIFR